MRIGINVFSISPCYKGGVNSFTFGLIDAFGRIDNPHTFVIFVNADNREMFKKYDADPRFRLVEINQTNHRLVRSGFYRLPWKIRYRWPAGVLNGILNGPSATIMAGQADVHFVPFCPPFLFPFPAKPTIYSIHDVQHAHFPEFFSPQQLLERKTQFDQCVNHATVIQASSRYMRLDFLKHFPSLDETKVVVIREGVDIDVFRRPQATVEVVKRYGLPKSFLLYPAQLWHHKNHITILRALKRLRERNIVISLVLTGARYEASQGIFDFIEQNSLSSQVFYLGLVPFEDIVALYQASQFLIMSSLHESSSMPILEAAAAGAAIIASRTPAIEEMAENLEMQLFTPTDDNELANLLEAAWSDDSMRRRQIEANKTNISRFSWDNAARKYIEVFESMVGPSERRRA
jgi:glycosyltransferase involved in cell wall biosynthesis